MMLKLGIAVILVLTLCCVVLVTASLADEDKDEKVTIEQLPAAVRATLENAAKGGTIEEIEKELEDGQTIYSAEILKDGKKIEVEISADGKLLETETDDDDADDDDADEADDDD